MKSVAIFILGLLIGAFACHLFISRPAVTVTDILVEHDTVTIFAPTPTTVRPIGNVTARLPIAAATSRRDHRPTSANADSLDTDETASNTAVEDEDTPTDSVEVEIPITQNVYEGERYRAYISGYRPTLDSIFIYNSTTTVIERHTAPRQSRWSLGITAGYGLTPDRVAPYLGIGVTYSILSF